MNFDTLFQVKDLHSAALYFLQKTNSISEDLSSITNLKKCKTLKADIITLPSKYFERDYESYDIDNEHGIKVKKQLEKRYKYNFKDKKKDNGNDSKSPTNTTIFASNICIVLSKEIDKNALGIEDNYYYYIVYKKRILNTWAENFGIKKYRNSPGFYFPFSILKHIDDNKVKETSEIIIVLADATYGSGIPRVFRITSSEFFKYFFKHKMPMMINAYGQNVTGIPIEVLKEEEMK